QQPPPAEEGGPASLANDPNTIEFFPPALALIIRAPTRVHYSPFGGIIGGKYKKADAAAWAEMVGKDLIAGRGPDKNKPNVAGAAAANAAVAKNNKFAEELDPTKIWEDAFAQGGIEPALVLATADFLFEYGHIKHVAEF